MSRFYISKGDYTVDNKIMIEKLEELKERINLVDTKKIEADFADPVAAMKGYATRIINTEISTLNGELPAPDDLVVAEIENMMKNK